MQWAKSQVDDLEKTTVGVRFKVFTLGAEPLTFCAFFGLSIFSAKMELVHFLVCIFLHFLFEFFFLHCLVCSNTR